MAFYTSLTIAAVTGFAGAVIGAAGARGSEHATAKAYIVAEVQVNDTAAYRPYIQRTGPIVAKYGGHYLVRGGATESFEGAKPAGRVAVIEFPDMASLKRFETSPEYEQVKPIRHKAATSRVFGVEGVAP